MLPFMAFIFISVFLIHALCMISYFYLLNKLRNANSVLNYDIGARRISMKRMKLIRERCENEFEIKIVDQLIRVSSILRFVTIAYLLLIFVQCCIWFIQA